MTQLCSWECFLSAAGWPHPIGWAVLLNTQSQPSHPALFPAAGVDQPLALSPLTTIIATASQPAVSVSSLPAVPAPLPAPANRKLLQGGSAPSPAPAAPGRGSGGTGSGASKLDPDFAIAEQTSGNASASMVSTGGCTAGWVGRSGWQACRAGSRRQMMRQAEWR